VLADAVDGQAIVGVEVVVLRRNRLAYRRCFGHADRGAYELLTGQHAGSLDGVVVHFS